MLEGSREGVIVGCLSLRVSAVVLRLFLFTIRHVRKVLLGIVRVRSRCYGKNPVGLLAALVWLKVFGCLTGLIENHFGAAPGGGD